mmetsp:Transcript_13430/g.23978  ORF Transcript_13430/g.23978 Transcript_13430/m.23978 type:complete len:93 (+) Transcript_13430:158-436(+)
MVSCTPSPGIREELNWFTTDVSSSHSTRRMAMTLAWAHPAQFWFCFQVYGVQENRLCAHSPSLNGTGIIFRRMHSMYSRTNLENIKSHPLNL